MLTQPLIEGITLILASSVATNRKGLALPMEQLSENLLENTATITAVAWDERLAFWISQIGSPPLTTTACIALGVLSLPASRSTWYWMGIYLLLVVLMPLLYLVWLLKKGHITDIHLKVREQRTRPLLVTVAAAFLAWGILHFGAAPRLLVALAAAMCLQTVIFLAITLRWKISFHSASAAGMAVMAWLVVGSLSIGFALSVPIIAWARVRLQRHTAGQTFAGATLGGGILLSVLYMYLLI